MSCQACEAIAAGWQSDSPPPLCRDCESDGCHEAECLYCGRETVTPDTVPSAGDDAVWRDLAKAHRVDCEWVLTRAHRREGKP